MPSTDDIGSRGENIFSVLLTQPYGAKEEFLFRPHFLGGKFATLDYLVELIGRERAAYFFVQVKTTTLGFTKKRPVRLLVSVPAQDVERMVKYPAPTYVVGIDGVNVQGYIGSVNGEMKGPIPSLPIDYPLNPANLKLLWDEVNDFWNSRNMVLKDSAFTI
jgi:hypothetical protein